MHLSLFLTAFPMALSQYPSTDPNALAQPPPAATTNMLHGSPHPTLHVSGLAPPPPVSSQAGRAAYAHAHAHAHALPGSGEQKSSLPPPFTFEFGAPHVYGRPPTAPFTKGEQRPTCRCAASLVMLEEREGNPL